MSGIVFNFHDVALLFVAGECGLLAMLFLACRRVGSRAYTLLALFLILNMLVAIDTLIYWGDAFRYWAFHLSPDLFFLFGFAYFLQGPALYFYLHSITDREFSFRRQHLLHLIPAFSAQFYLYIAYHSYPADIQGELVLNREIFSVTGGYHDVFVFLQKTVGVVYGVVCVLFLRRRLTAGLSPIQQRKDRVSPWLWLVTGGFLLAWSWNLITHFFGVFAPGKDSELMGVIGNYINVLLINALLFYSLAVGDVLVRSGRIRKSSQPDTPEPVDQDLIEKVCAAMEREKLYLNPRLTVEKVAVHLALPQRQVSSLIKHRFECNFLEYVNGYRVRQAKDALADPTNRDLSVLDIAVKSGFNSKATFNRFFKKLVGVTPSEYRRHCLAE